MERVTRMLNLFSAAVLLATGLYLQVAFGELLSTTVRAMIGVAVLTYFFFNLNCVAVADEGSSGAISGSQL